MLAVCIVKCEPLGFPKVVRAVEAKDEEDAYEWALQFVRDLQPQKTWSRGTNDFEFEQAIGTLGKLIFTDGMTHDGKTHVLNWLEETNAFEFNENEWWFDSDYTDLDDPRIKDAEDQTTITVQIISIERY
jgi:hypothetical protein